MRKLLTSLLLAALCAHAALAADKLAGARSLAMAGDTAYEAGDFQGATERYAAALSDGLDHADLHFNLGNSYYKLGELGRAIACYERALLRAPRHAAARANLDRARQQIRDEAFAPLRMPLFLQPLGWIYGRIELNEWALLALLSFLLAALSGVLGQWWIRLRRPLRPLLFSCVVVAVLSLSLAGMHTVRDHRRSRGVVTIEEVDVRSGPGPSYNLSFKIHEGLTVFVSERRGDWLQIHLGGQLVGWVPAAQIEII